MNYNRYIACMINKNKDSMFGLIPVLDDTMVGCARYCVKYIKNMLDSEYDISEEEVRVEVIANNWIAYYAILRYSDDERWTFDYISNILARSFIEVCVDNNIDCIRKIMDYINREK